jgi:hypothetical protein
LEPRPRRNASDQSFDAMDGTLVLGEPVGVAGDGLVLSGLPFPHVRELDLVARLDGGDDGNMVFETGVALADAVDGVADAVDLVAEPVGLLAEAVHGCR